MMKKHIQAVILAAGRSTRCYPLTLSRPKPLLPVVDKTIIEHNLTQLQGLVDEVIIVVGYLAERMEAHLGDRYGDLPLYYVRQTEQRGTAHALQTVKDRLGDRFVVINGDDLYDHTDIQATLAYDNALLGAYHDDAARFGLLQVEDGTVVDIIEKQKDAGRGLVNTGLHVFNKRIFDNDIVMSVRGEFELVDYVRVADPVNLVESTGGWIPVSYPWNLLEANAFVLQKLRPRIEGQMDDGVHVAGNVSIGPGSQIMAGTTIEGPVYIGANCVIGPNAYLRPDTVILDGCHIGHGVEVVDSLILPAARCKHASYIGHSVIGSNVNIGAGLITADYRHDGGQVSTLVKGEKINSFRTKLGAFIGDEVRLGVRTTLYPGRKIWPKQTTLPGMIVDKDIV